MLIFLDGFLYDDRGKRSKCVHACMISILTLGPAKHEEVAFVRIPNVIELRELFAMEQFVSSVRGKNLFLTLTSFISFSYRRSIYE
jgi:hypothetical protein